MNEEQAEQRWQGRLLCPDGGCIGVLDARGRCPICGRIDASAAERRPADEPADEPIAESPPPAEGPAAAAPTAASEREDGGDEWQTRQLCDDGACIGVIVEGRCNTCGKAPGT